MPIFFSESNGFLLATLPTLWSIRLIVVLCTDTPVSAMELCSFSRVTLGLCASSLIYALLAQSMSFGVRPSLGRFAVVPCSFNFVGRFDVLLGIIKDSGIFL